MKRSEELDLIKQYSEIMREAILMGYEWEIPDVAAIKLVKIGEGEPLEGKSGQYFYSDGTNYKFDVIFKGAALNRNTSYMVHPNILNKAKKLIQKNQSDYRTL